MTKHIQGCRREGACSCGFIIREADPAEAKRARDIERAARAVVRKAMVQPGGLRFGFPTWQIDNASITALKNALETV